MTEDQSAFKHFLSDSQLQHERCSLGGGRRARSSASCCDQTLYSALYGEKRQHFWQLGERFGAVSDNLLQLCILIIAAPEEKGRGRKERARGAAREREETLTGESAQQKRTEPFSSTYHYACV